VCLKASSLNYRRICPDYWVHFTFKVLSALINTYSGAKIDDRRDEKSGFLWVYSGSRRSDENQKLDDWLKKNGFIYDGKLSGWYYPFD